MEDRLGEEGDHTTPPVAEVTVLAHKTRLSDSHFMADWCKVHPEARSNTFITDTEEQAVGMQRSEGHWWSGYTVLEFELPLDVTMPEKEAFEVNEVSLAEMQKYEKDL